MTTMTGSRPLAAVRSPKYRGHCRTALHRGPLISGVLRLWSPIAFNRPENLHLDTPATLLTPKFHKAQGPKS